MSRLINYLNEESFMLEKIKELLQDCRPYIRDLKRTNHFPNRMLYSGRSSDGMWIERKVRKDRDPKDTPKVVHETLDQLFYNEFGIKARSQTLFTFPTWSNASNYGTGVFMIFPVGKYEIIWSDRITDLYGDMVDTLKDIVKPEDRGFIDIVDAEWDRIGVDKGLATRLANWLYENFPVDKFYRKGGLNNALGLNSEIMVYCDKWVGINEDKFREHCKSERLTFEQGLEFILSD